MLRDFFRKYGWNYIPGAIFLYLTFAVPDATMDPNARAPGAGQRH